jgi:hypothetical protein
MSPQVHDRAHHLHVREAQPLVEYVARVEAQAHRAGRHEEGIFLVAQLERVYRDPGEEISADGPDVHGAPAPQRRLEPGHDVVAHTLPPERRLGDGNHHRHHHEAEEEHDAPADQRDQPAARH